MLALVVLLAAQAAPLPPSAPAAVRMTERLQELRAWLEAAECERVIASSMYVEDHRLATPAERHEAMFMRAYCLVTLGNLGEASGIFREILGEDLEAQPPFEVEPRVQVLIDAARATLVQERAAARAAERQRIIDKLDMKIARPLNITGGERAIFVVALADPDGVVRSMRIDFKKEGDPEFYGLPVVKQADGRWRGEIPGTYTRTESGVTLQWIISASDANGEALVATGTREQPEVLQVGPGSLIALDVKANERVPQPARILYALVTPPLVASLFFVGADGAIVALDNLVGRGTPGVSGVARVGRAFAPPLAAAAGTFAATYAILDPTWPQVVPAVVVGGVLLGYGVAAAGDDAPIADTFRPDTRDVDLSRPDDAAQALFVTTAVIAAAAVPTAFVLLDPPSE